MPQSLDHEDFKPNQSRTPSGAAIVAKRPEQLKLTALIVDDDETDRLRLKKLCLKAGLTVVFTEATTIAELRAAMDNQAFDLIFLDYHLGMETGLDALHAVTTHEEQTGAIPIMVTGVGRHDVIIEAMRSGCGDYLIKEELTTESLRKAITSAIERRVLIAALSTEARFRETLQQTLSRFANSSAPEMRRLLSGMLRRLRDIRQAPELKGKLASDIAAISESCDSLFLALNKMVASIDSEGVSIQDHHPTISAPN